MKEQKTTHWTKRLLTAFLALVMVLGALPLTRSVTTAQALSIVANGPVAGMNLSTAKYIDWLGSGSNPDTAIDDSGSSVNNIGDYYRLYVDFKAELEPTDLLIMVDRSASMAYKMSVSSTSYASNENDWRATKLINYLNGENGFIKSF